MADKIGYQHGLDAALLREKNLHPEHRAAWEKRTATLKSLVKGHNEFEDRLSALEAQAPAPFPFRG